MSAPVTDLGIVDPHTEAMAVQELAGDPCFAARAQDLRLLSGALAAPEDTSGWGSVDLFAAFAPESTITVPRAGRSGAERVLGVLAAVTVFLPVAWTWYSMSVAAGAYRSMLAAVQTGGASFLQLWATGFDGRLGALHQLPQMAAVSVALIVLAVVIVVAQRSIAAARSLQEADRYQEAETALLSALAAATRRLAVRPVSSNEEFETVVTRSLRDLQRAHQHSAQAAERFDGTVTAANATITDALTLVQPMLGEIRSAIDTMRHTTLELEEATRSATDAARQAAPSLNAELQRASAEWQTSHRLAAQGANQTVAGAADALARVASDLDASAVRLADGVAGLQSAGERVPGLLAASLQAATVDAVRQIREAAPAYERTSAELAQAVSRLDGALLLNQSSVQAQVTELTQARDALEQVLVGLRVLVAAPAPGRAA